MAGQRRTGTTSAPIGEMSSALGRQLRLARLVLWWEDAWRLGWPLPALASGFLAVALFDVLPMLPGWLHALGLGLFALAALAAAWRLRTLSWPSLDDARRRLERDSGFAHRPLRGLADHLEAGAGDRLSRALWDAERLRLGRLLERIRLRGPAPGLARHDPLGLRFLPLLLLAVALAGGWHDGIGRIGRALDPDLSRLAGPAPVLQVWLTPPAYTGKPPVMLESIDPTPLIVPAGSRLLAVLQGGKGKAQLFEAESPAHPFQPQDGDSQRLETGLTRNGQVRIRQGRRLIAAWPVTVVEVQPPTIGFASPPETDRQGRLRLDVEGRDAYGIAKAWATIRRTDAPDAPPLVIDLPLGGAHPTDLRQAAWHDLTGHPWAGLPVSIEPSAENVAGRVASGEPVRIVLPERGFNNPVARAIVAERRKLIAQPDQREEPAEALARIAGNPEGFGNDLTVYLNLSTAVSRLMRDRSAEAVPSVADMLWQVALKIEEGDKPEAQRALDEAARALEKALADGAPQAEIERLMNELRSAMDRYFDALAEQAAKAGTPLLPDDPDRPSVSAQDLDDMLEQMRDLSRTGSQDAAQKLLSEMRQMLDGLEASLGGGAPSREAREAGRAMRELRDLTSQQRRLLDDTFRRAQQQPAPSSRLEGERARPRDRSQAGTGHPEDGPANVEADRQDGLRKRLDQFTQSLGKLGVDTPETLGQAGQAMDDATLSLRRGETQDAVEAQTEALARLQEGARGAAEALAKRMGGGLTRQGLGSGRDPLGRPLRNGGDGDDRTVKIPERASTQKAREVLEELRRRAGQAERPAAERDYLQRLLKQFF